MISAALGIWLIPLLAFVIQIFAGRRLPRQGDWVSIGAILISLVMSLGLLVTALTHYDPDFAVGATADWLTLGTRVFAVGILLNNLSIIMAVIVCLISALVHIYSVGYMHGDPRYARYFGYLSLFSFSMLGIVLADNLLVLYASWELVGLSSYLLIGFWFEKDSASDAGKKAFLVNRVGDVGMFVGIMIIYSTLGTFRFDEIFAGVADGRLAGAALTMTGIFLFCGAVGKSAQFPLHVWLPDAMEGPTPVSALIHAATMVAAGVYMIARIFPMLSPDALLVIAYIDAITLTMAATIAIVQTDIKRVLAYSTVSQLGYMVMALGVGSYVAGFFHLTTHAMFKACLFLCAGSVIHAVHSQEVSDMGGLRKKMPVTFWTFLIATLAISGVPLTTGFLSKDMILAGALGFSMEQPRHFLLPLAGFLSAGITAFYMFRVTFLTFYGEPKNREKYDHAHESPASMAGPLVVLACLSVFIVFTFPSVNPASAEGGWFTHLIQEPASLADPGTGGSHAAAHQPAHAVEAAGHAAHHDPAHYPAMAISILVAGLGIFLAYRTYYQQRISADAWAQRLSGLYRLFRNKWYFDEIYHATAVRGLLGLNELLKWFDIHIIDGFVNGCGYVTRQTSAGSGRFDNRVVDGAVNGLATSTLLWGRVMRTVQTGRIQNYLIGIVTGILAVLILRML